MTQLSISVLNDWADRDRDAAAGRFRPVAMRRIPPRVALGLAILFGLAALPGALAFGWIAAGVLLLGLLAGWAYDLGLKTTKLSFLPFAVAFPLLPTWIGLIAGRSLERLSWLVVGGALLATAIHLADALPDRASDAAAGVRTLAVQLDPNGLRRVMVATLLLGSLVIVASLWQRPLIAIVLAVMELISALFLVRIARHRPEQARWIVAVSGFGAALAWFAGHAGG